MLKLGILACIALWTLVAHRLATNPQFAVRDWITPFMVLFTDLLKVLWTLWTQLKRKQQEASEVNKLAEEKRKLQNLSDKLQFSISAAKLATLSSEEATRQDVEELAKITRFMHEQEEPASVILSFFGTGCF